MTKQTGYDMIVRLSRETSGAHLNPWFTGRAVRKKLEKSSSKRLTNEIRYDMMDRLSRETHLTPINGRAGKRTSKNFFKKVAENA